VIAVDGQLACTEAGDRGGAGRVGQFQCPEGQRDRLASQAGVEGDRVIACVAIGVGDCLAEAHNAVVRIDFIRGGRHNERVVDGQRCGDEGGVAARVRGRRLDIVRPTGSAVGTTTLQFVPLTVAVSGVVVTPGITTSTTAVPSLVLTVPASVGWLFVVASAAAVTVGLLVSGSAQVSVFWNVNVVALVFHGLTICSTPILSYW